MEVIISEFGKLLRHWRKARGCSQLSLGLTAEVSARHISFLETGRAQPSREMVLHLASTLDIPLSQRNDLLRASGFADAYSRLGLEERAMEPVRQALSFMLAKHEPFPAVVLDRDWNILMANQPYQQLGQMAQNLQPAFAATPNILQLLFDPAGFRPFVENWPAVACMLLQRLQRECAIYQNRQAGLLERLLAYPDIPASWKQFNPDVPTEPMLQLVLRFGQTRLKLFSTLSSFGTAVDVTMQELVIEQYFPADESTRRFFEEL